MAVNTAQTKASCWITIPSTKRGLKGRRREGKSFCVYENTSKNHFQKSEYSDRRGGNKALIGNLKQFNKHHCAHPCSRFRLHSDTGRGRLQANTQYVWMGVQGEPGSNDQPAQVQHLPAPPNTLLYFPFCQMESQSHKIITLFWLEKTSRFN